MINEQYVWLTWASAFLVPWAALYLALPLQRKTMLWASLFTAPFGLTEPLFVPAYWNPPSLFNLAQRIGFDIESLIFTFAIGGVTSVLYTVLTGRSTRSMATHEKRQPLHRHHHKALATPFIVFPLLYFCPWNPIYAGIVAMLIGAVTTVLCRPDLKTKTWVGGLLFLGYYVVFLLGLEWSAPGYIERVWNLAALSGLLVLGMPIEELAWAIAFGLYWSGVYEHFTWRSLTRVEPDRSRSG
ncbi:MAG: lycopene cyclase domain-containing protein [Pseudomonadota bacterium]